MRKLFYSLFLSGLLIGSFLAGSWFARQEAVKGNPSQGKASTGNAGAKSDTGADPDLSSPPSGTVKISAEKQQVIGIQVAVVEKRPMNHSLRILGRVAVDELRVYIINTAAAGWVRNVSPVTVGSVVRKGQKLATFYSPEFLSSQQAYFYALNALDRFMNQDPPNLAQINLTKANIQQVRRFLAEPRYGRHAN